MEGSRFTAPFPGLYAFEPAQTDLFFGRDKEVGELITKLRAQRLVGVVGISGIGKSSLVRAGVIPWLEQGYMADSAKRWRVIMLKPGNAPLTVLARKLAACFDVAEEKASAELAHSSRGLLRFAGARLESDEALFILVDQFEELMRFLDDTAAKRQEAAEFVDLILGATGHGALEPAGEGKPQVFIVLTMRSEYLGKCTRFSGLAEALNDGQFLVPRLERDQLKLAIEGPIAMAGARITPALTQALLNDAATEIDQLPLMQFALRRMWSISADARARGEPIDLKHYQRIGGSIVEFLNIAADEVVTIVERRDPRNRLMVRRLFQRLVEPGAADEEVRRPAPLSELVAVAEAPDATLRPVIEEFARSGFLTLSADDDPEVDITHESLIRRWKKLNAWVKNEADSADIYVRLARAAAREASPYGGPDLREALAWRKESQPTEAWAARYPVENASYRKAMAFLDYSQRRRRVIGGMILAVLLIVLTTSASLLYYARILHQHQRAVVVDRLFFLAQNLANGPSNLAQKSLLLGLEAAKLQRPAYLDRFLREQSDAMPPLLTRIEQAGDMAALEFAADGKRLIGAGGDKTLRLWDVASGRELARATLAYPIGALRYDPASGHVATLAFDPAANPQADDKPNLHVALWKIEDAALRGPLFEASLIGDADLAFGGGRLWFADTKTLSSLRLDAIASGTATIALASEGPVFTPDGRYLLSSAAAGATLRNLASGDTQMLVFPERIPAGGVNSILVSPDSRYASVTAYLAGGGPSRRKIYVWQLDPLERVGAGIEADPFGDALALSPGGRFVAHMVSASLPTATVERVADGTQIGSAVEQDREASGISWRSAGFSHDGKRALLTVGASGVRIFTLDPWRESGRIGLGVPPGRLAWSADDRRVALASEGGLVTIWNLGEVEGGAPSGALSGFKPSPSRRYSVGLHGAGTALLDADRGTLLLELPSASLSDLVFSADERRLAAIDPRTRKVSIYALPERKFICAFDYPGSNVAAAFRRSDAFLLVTSAGHLRGWSTDRCQPVTDLSFEAEAAVSTGSTTWQAFLSPLGTRLGFVSARTLTSPVALWDTETGKPLGTTTMEAPSVVVFSPDDALVAGRTGGELTVWRTASARLLWRQPVNWESQPVFDPTGRKLAIGSGYVVRVFDAGSGKVLFEDSDESASTMLGGLAFDRLGNFLATARRGRIKIWDIGAGVQVSEIPVNAQLTFLHLFAFTADNARLLFGADSRTSTTAELHAFWWRGQDIVREGCRRVAFNLAPDDWKRLGGGYAPTEPTCPGLPVRE